MIEHPSAHPPFPPLRPLPQLPPAMGSDVTALHIIHAAERRRSTPEVLAAIARYFPQAASIGQHARERR